MLFHEAIGGDVAIFQNLEQGIDPGLDVKKFIDNHNIFSGNNAISGLEIAFFIPDRNLQLLKNIFQPVEIMLGIFDHIFVLFICKTAISERGNPIWNRSNPAMKLEKSLIYLRLSAIMMPLLLSAPEVTGQRFSAGMSAGFNACQIDGDLLAGFDKIGLTAGIRTVIEFESVWNVSMEFLYSERGSRPDVFNPTYDPDINISLKYVEIPVFVSLGDWYQEEGDYYKASFQAGLSYGRLLDAKTTDYYHSEEDGGYFTQVTNLFARGGV